MKEIETIIIERREPPKNYSLSLEKVKELAKEGIVIPIYRTISSDLYTPVSTYLKLTEENKRGKENESSNFSPSFLLESVEGGESIGRYSYIGISPKEGIVVRHNEISELRPDGTITTQSGERIDPLKAIREKMSKTVVKTPGVPPFSGGYVGYLGYEVVGAFEDKVPKSKPDPLGIPEAMLFNFDNVIVFDNVRNELKVVGNINVEDVGNLERQYQETTSKIDQIVDRINSSTRFESKKREENAVHNAEQSNFEKEEYLKAIGKIKEYIIAGDVIQVVLSQKWARKTEVEPFYLYRALRKINPSPFMAYINCGNFQLIGASPELLLKVEDRNISTWPIAGTRPRGQTPEDDERLAEELKKDEKENAEHNMLLDLGRNDIGRVSVPGTVKVPRVKQVERFSHVMHMTSEVQGRLSDEYTSLDALRSAFPAGTVSGAPKIRAMQIINEVEPETRGPYAGAMGYVSYNGNLEMAITIRTMVFKEGIAYIQAGGGIVYDSDPNTEWDETVRKAAASFRTIDLAENEY